MPTQRRNALHSSNPLEWRPEESTRRTSAFCLSGEWNDDNFDVLANGAVVGQIFKANAAPVGSPWVWTLAFEPHGDEGVRRYRVEAKGLSLPFRTLPRTGQKEEPGCVGSDAGGRGGLQLSRYPNNPEPRWRRQPARRARPPSARLSTAFTAPISRRPSEPSCPRAVSGLQTRTS
jgi:hypothetical protein